MAAEKPGKKPMDRQRKEAAQPFSEAVTLRIEGANGSATVAVLPFIEWAFDVRHLLGTGDFFGCAEGMLAPGEMAKVIKVRPNNDQFIEFLNSWKHETGLDLGESQAS